MTDGLRAPEDAQPSVASTASGNSRRPLRRRGLRPMSERRQRVNRERARVLIEAWGKRPWTCALRRLANHRLGVPGAAGQVMPSCFGRVNAHERKSRARAGRTDANLLDVDGMIPLCARHNEWCESHPNAARTLGLTVHSWE